MSSARNTTRRGSTQVSPPLGEPQPHLDVTTSMKHGQNYGCGSSSAPSSDSQTIDEDYMTSTEYLGSTEMEDELKNASDDSLAYLLNEVEIIDGKGQRRSETGQFLVKNVYDLQRGERVVVPLSDQDQPIKKGGVVFARFVGHMVRIETMVSLANKTWRDVGEDKKAKLVRFIRDKFYLPQSKCIDRMILVHCAKKWRDYKYDLRRKATNRCQYPKDVAYWNKPQSIPTNVWAQVVDYWYSKKFKQISDGAKDSQANKLHVHTTGSKSFARKRDEFEIKKKRKVGPIDFFIDCHKRTDGSYIDPLSKEYVEVAIDMIRKKTGRTSFSEATIKAEIEAHFELRGPDNRGRVKGYGLGVTPSQFRLASYSRERCSSSMGFDARVASLQQQMANMQAQHQQQIAALQAQIAALQAERAESSSSNFAGVV